MHHRSILVASLLVAGVAVVALRARSIQQSPNYDSLIQTTAREATRSGIRVDDLSAIPALWSVATPGVLRGIWVLRDGHTVASFRGADAESEVVMLFSGTGGEVWREEIGALQSRNVRESSDGSVFTVACVGDEEAVTLVVSTTGELLLVARSETLVPAPGQDFLVRMSCETRWPWTEVGTTLAETNRVDWGGHCRIDLSGVPVTDHGWLLDTAAGEEVFAVSGETIATRRLDGDHYVTTGRRYDGTIIWTRQEVATATPSGAFEDSEFFVVCCDQGSTGPVFTSVGLADGREEGRGVYSTIRDVHVLARGFRLVASVPGEKQSDPSRLVSIITHADFSPAAILQPPSGSHADDFVVHGAIATGTAHSEQDPVDTRTVFYELPSDEQPATAMIAPLLIDIDGTWRLVAEREDKWILVGSNASGMLSCIEVSQQD